MRFGFIIIVTSLLQSKVNVNGYTSSNSVLLTPCEWNVTLFYIEEVRRERMQLNVLLKKISERI